MSALRDLALQRNTEQNPMSWILSEGRGRRETYALAPSSLILLTWREATQAMTSTPLPPAGSAGLGLGPFPTRGLAVFRCMAVPLAEAGKTPRSHHVCGVDRLMFSRRPCELSDGSLCLFASWVDDMCFKTSWLLRPRPETFRLEGEPWGLGSVPPLGSRQPLLPAAKMHRVAHPGLWPQG